ncbi:MAG: YhdH/YhfP family quinone oxidoreductase [Chlorobi bacterium]|nr:YhdH/YhfP family quinone oxidoreductase [Chlorobiota bacterium]
MENLSFKAFVTKELEANKFERSIETRQISDLPQGDVLIEVFFSALNYKDALSARGHKGISRNYPHTPGIDASGIVAESNSSDFLPGQKVLVTGYDLGMNTDGGFAEYIRVPASWVVPLPEKMSLREAMIWGTAGFTAAISINELQRHDVTPDKGHVLVTGATGGVSTLAIGMLKKAGYSVVASTGKTDQKEMLMKLGADEVIDRADADDQSNRPLLRGRWAGVLDSVGGSTLSSVIRSTKLHGAVCCFGNVTGDNLETSVYPFLLRGITLIGIDSAEKEMPYRLNIWKRISEELKFDNINDYVKEVDLEGLSKEIDVMLKGGQIGKVIVNMKK